MAVTLSHTMLARAFDYYRRERAAWPGAALRDAAQRLLALLGPRADEAVTLGLRAFDGGEPDERLVLGVAAFQALHRLTVDGKLGAGTLEKISALEREIAAAAARSAAPPDALLDDREYAQALSYYARRRSAGTLPDAALRDLGTRMAAVEPALSSDANARIACAAYTDGAPSRDFLEALAR